MGWIILKVKRLKGARPLVSAVRAGREAGSAVLFAPCKLDSLFLIPGTLLITLARCLFHPCICSDFVYQPDIPEGMINCLFVLMQRQTLVTSGTRVPARTGLGWGGDEICPPLPTPWSSSSPSSVATDPPGFPVLPVTPVVLSVVGHCSSPCSARQLVE